ncbi:hypothetical protein J6590_024104 [Homalodisca vitripennis]|nr:hypothetical protein J6590_024104 [Homalodisca vitripennis]
MCGASPDSALLSVRVRAYKATTWPFSRNLNLLILYETVAGISPTLYITLHDSFSTKDTRLKFRDRLYISNNSSNLIADRNQDLLSELSWVGMYFISSGRFRERSRPKRNRTLLQYPRYPDYDIQRSSTYSYTNVDVPHITGVCECVSKHRRWSWSGISDLSLIKTKRLVRWEGEGGSKLKHIAVGKRHPSGTLSRNSFGPAL